MFLPNAARIKSARLTLGIAGIPDPKLQVQDMFPPDKWWRWRPRRWWRSSWPTSLSLTTSPTTSSLLRVISYLHLFKNFLCLTTSPTTSCLLRVISYLHLFSCTHEATHYHVSMWPRTYYPCPSTSFSFIFLWLFCSLWCQGFGIQQKFPLPDNITNNILLKVFSNRRLSPFLWD